MRTACHTSSPRQIQKQYTWWCYSLFHACNCVCGVRSIMSVITCSSCGNYDLLPLRRYSHACLQIVLLRSFTSLLLSTRRSCVNGCLLAIIQSSLPLWSFGLSGPITLCATAYLDALISSCSKLMWYKYERLTYLDVYKAALTRRRMQKHTSLHFRLIWAFHLIL